MSDKEIIDAVQVYLNQGFSLMNEATAQFQHAAETWRSMAGDVKPNPERVLFCSPVTGKIETGANPYGGLWFVTVKYAELYNSSSNTKAYHTGVDLNLPDYKDSGAPVYAAADGCA
jgi:hypothetical protein